MCNLAKPFLIIYKKTYMKNFTTITMKSIFMLMISLYVLPSFSQTTMSREEIALAKAEDKLNTKRLKLVEYKMQIEAADSLYVAGEKLQVDSKIMKGEGRDEEKAVEKKYKVDSKPYKKAMKSKDRKEASQARTDLKVITTKYKTDLKAAQNKVKVAERNIVNSGRMMDKADKKLDMLSQKLKAAEKAYKDAEKALNKLKSGE